MENTKRKREVSPLRILHILEDIAIVVPLIIVLIMTILNVILRYVFLTGILWSEEFIGFCMLFIGIIGAAACVRDRLNTSLDGVVCKFSLKTQKAFYFADNALVTVMLAYFTYGGIQFTKTVGSQQSFILNWPMKVFYAMIPIGTFLCLVEEIINVVTDIKNKECRFKTIEELIAEEEAAGEAKDTAGGKGAGT